VYPANLAPERGRGSKWGTVPLPFFPPLHCKFSPGEGLKALGYDYAAVFWMARRYTGLILD